MNFDSIRRSVQHFGVGSTCYDLAYRALNRGVGFKVLKGLTIGRVDPSYLTCDPRYDCRFLDSTRLRALGRDPANEMPAEFLDEALGKGDECYGILDGERLASYGWYARTPTRIDPADLRLHFSADYIYMYKGLTHPAYRGQRLHAIGMTQALEKYLARGCKGLVSYVEANNFASLRSVDRMGYREIGRIVLLRLGGRYLTRASRGCREYGLRVEPILPDRLHPARVNTP